MCVEISNHAAQRYAERIADRESLSDINIYVQRNMEKIEEDINKMLTHSTFIYYGKVGGKDKNAVNVYLSGTWVILLDQTKSKVITLYKVDFNVGEEFNKQFIQLVLDRMNRHAQELEERRADISDEKENYLRIIHDNEEQISEYRAMIKRLERLNEDYKEIVTNMDTNCAVVELAIRKDVEDLIRKW